MNKERREGGMDGERERESERESERCAYMNVIKVDQGPIDVLVYIGPWVDQYIYISILNLILWYCHNLNQLIAGFVWKMI